MSDNQAEFIDTLSNAFIEIKALGEPKREANGILAFSYYIEIFSIIIKNARSSFAKEKQQFLDRRRDLLRNNKMSEYKELVIEMVQMQEMIDTNHLVGAMEHIGLS